MPPPATVGEFIEVVRKSGLVADAQLQTELTRLKEQPHSLESIEQLAQALIRDGILTKFQAKQLKLGRHKRFEIAGKYRLLELLGVGGMGAVYLCEHMFMKRLVALKVLPVEKLEDPSALARFYREARAVAAMDHPNIVRAYDIDKYEQLHFLVMEYVDGASLQEIVARHGPISPERAANYIAQAAQGLQHAFELGLVHRDIKPGNLLLDRSGTIKILDMGLARFFDQTHDNLTEKFDNNCVLGTADYLAPEQTMSNVVDIRADIYALGGSMYFALTGQSPFPDGTIASKLMAHQTREPKPVQEFRSDVPPEILTILHRMMRKNPNDRYQTPAELYEALQPWANFEYAVPPAHEMPEVCPAVRALASYSAITSSSRSSVVTYSTITKVGGSSAPPASKPQSWTPSPSDSRTVPKAPAAPPAAQPSEIPTFRSTQTVPVESRNKPAAATPPVSLTDSSSDAELFFLPDTVTRSTPRKHPSTRRSSTSRPGSRPTTSGSNRTLLLIILAILTGIGLLALLLILIR